MSIAWWQAAIMGVVEGVTEYLPVSSTGHLILTERLLGIEDSSASKAYAVVIQGGAIMAVLGLYAARVKSAVRGVLGHDPVGKALAVNLIAAFVPTAVIGLLFSKFVKAHFFGMAPIAFAWFAGGAVILVLSWRKPDSESRLPRLDNSTGFELEELPMKAAMMIGFAQAIALWPGTSRSLVTILAGVMVGMKLRAAVEFSFLLGVITLAAATLHDAVGEREALASEIGISSILIGVIVSWIAAMIAIKWLVGYLNKHGLEVFGYYRVAISLIIVVLLASGKMDN